jgi:hypothetical protein
VRSIAARLGCRPSLWSVDSGDRTTDASAESAYSHVVNGASNGAIIVLRYDKPARRQRNARGPASGPSTRCALPATSW